MKKWAAHEQKQSGVWKNKIKKEFFEMVLKADQNGDGKLDKWELYEFCVSNYIAKDEMWNAEIEPWFVLNLLKWIQFKYWNLSRPEHIPSHVGIFEQITILIL